MAGRIGQDLGREGIATLMAHIGEAASDPPIGWTRRPLGPRARIPPVVG
jgi:hypothetical protein